MKANSFRWRLVEEKRWSPGLRRAFRSRPQCWFGLNQSSAPARRPIDVLHRIRGGPELPFGIFILEFRNSLHLFNSAPPPDWDARTSACATFLIDCLGAI